MKQHVISKIYLEQFAFIHKSDGKKICIKHIEEHKTTRHFIKSFNRHVDFFDIESENPQLVRAFEEINGQIETHYPEIIKQLEDKKCLSDKYSSYLLQYATNLICRSKYWRESIRTTLNSEHKLTFIKHILLHKIENQEEIDNIENNELLQLPTEKLLNRILPIFSDHLWFKICDFEIIFLKASDKKGWFTSDNPVVISQAPELTNIISKEPEHFLSKAETISDKTEIYFPLTPKYLAYIYNPSLKISSYNLRKFRPNSVNEISDEILDSIIRKIIEGSCEHIICPFDIEYETN